MHKASTAAINIEERRGSWNHPAHFHSELFHGLDPFDDGLTELFHSLFFRSHTDTWFPAISRFKVPVGDRTLSFVLWLPDNFHWHAKFSIPGFNAP